MQCFFKKAPSLGLSRIESQKCSVEMFRYSGNNSVREITLRGRLKFPSIQRSYRLATAPGDSVFASWSDTFWIAAPTRSPSVVVLSPIGALSRLDLKAADVVEDDPSILYQHAAACTSCFNDNDVVIDECTSTTQRRCPARKPCLVEMMEIFRIYA